MTEESPEVPIVQMEPDDLQLSIQAYDNGYFERHRGDDYYFRESFDHEFAAGALDDYKGLVLVYQIEEGTRFRKPVATVHAGLEFVFWYESTQH